MTQRTGYVRSHLSCSGVPCPRSHGSVRRKLDAVRVLCTGKEKSSGEYSLFPCCAALIVFCLDRSTSVGGFPPAAMVAVADPTARPPRTCWCVHWPRSCARSVSELLVIVVSPHLSVQGWRVVFNPYAEIRPHPCPHCSMEYKRRGWLVRHVLQNHKETDSYDAYIEQGADSDSAGDS